MSGQNEKTRPLALVTGATSGIGKAITIELVRLGHDVIAQGRNETVLDELSDHQGVTPLNLDLSDMGELSTALEGAQVDVLINNAGIMPPAVSFVEMEQAHIDATLQVNLGAALAVTRAVLPGMVARRKGHVFFTGSTSGQAPFPNMAVYGASKAALSSFAAALRCDLSGSGVRVTEIVAGRVETKLYRDALSDQARSDMYAAFDPVQPEDVARMMGTVLTFPAHVDVTRFDILPTAQFVGGGGFASKGK